MLSIFSRILSSYEVGHQSPGGHEQLDSFGLCAFLTSHQSQRKINYHF